MAKYSRYQDYVIRDGRLVGEFEEMYRDFADPWHATTAEEFASEKAVGINLLARLKARGRIAKVLELGCGLGHYSARIAALDLEVTGVDISATAVAKARERHAQPQFVAGGIEDYDLFRQRRPDVVVMAETTWYVLNRLRGFLDFLRTELPETYLLHLLSTYPPGVQQYGSEFFTDLDGIRRFFGMKYLESGEVYQPQVTRTWFLGTWSAESETAWL